MNFSGRKNAPKKAFSFRDMEYWHDVIKQIEEESADVKCPSDDSQKIKIRCGDEYLRKIGRCKVDGSSGTLVSPDQNKAIIDLLKKRGNIRAGSLRR